MDGLSGQVVGHPLCREVIELAVEVAALKEHRERLNGHLASLDARTLEALREVQTLPTEVEQRAYAVANDLRAELSSQIQTQVGLLRAEWQTSEAVRQAAHERELRETQAARAKLYASIGSTLVLAAAAGGPNVLDWVNQGIKLLFGGGK